MDKVEITRDLSHNSSNDKVGNDYDLPNDTAIKSHEKTILTVVGIVIYCSVTIGLYFIGYPSGYSVFPSIILSFLMAFIVILLAGVAIIIVLIIVGSICIMVAGGWKLTVDAAEKLKIKLSQPEILGDSPIEMTSNEV